MKVLWGICGSFCNHQAILNLLETNDNIKQLDIQFVISENCAECDTRFMESSQLIQQLESISGKKVFTSIVQAETVGPYADYELFVIAPCTASTSIPARLHGPATSRPTAGPLPCAYIPIPARAT